MDANAQRQWRHNFCKNNTSCPRCARKPGEPCFRSDNGVETDIGGLHALRWYACPPEPAIERLARVADTQK